MAETRKFGKFNILLKFYVDFYTKYLIWPNRTTISISIFVFEKIVKLD